MSNVSIFFIIAETERHREAETAEGGWKAARAEPARQDRKRAGAAEGARAVAVMIPRLLVDNTTIDTNFGNI